MADRYTIEVKGIESLRMRLSPESFRKGLLQGMEVAVITLRRELTDNLTGRILKRRSGILAEGITNRVRETKDLVVGEVGNTVRWRYGSRSGPLLLVHEKGATITPRKPGGFLRFKIGEDWITTKKVVIPAREPVKKAVKAKLTAMLNNIRTALLRKLGGNS